MGAALATVALWATGASAARVAVTPCPGASLRPGRARAAVIDAATLCLVNRIRAARRLAPLRMNAELAHVAVGQVRRMVRLDYFADISPAGQTPMSLITATHYPSAAAALSVGQNIAWGTGAYASPAAIVAAWMASAPHRAIILDGAYRDAGVAAAAAIPRVLGHGPGATYAMEFGLRRH